MTDTPLEYAQRGWRVIPIPAGKKFPEGFSRWQERATNDPDLVTQWWTEHPDHGVGIATGPATGLWVLDVDDYDSYRDLEKNHQPLPDTLTVITGSGGLHFYYKYPTDGTVIRNNASTRLGPGLDVRGDGGFVVAPPSTHPNGKQYEYDAGQPDEPVDAPQWLIDLVAEQPAQPTPINRGLRVVNDSDRPGDLYATQVDWATILEADGWTLHHTDRNGERHWTRPGKEHREGTSATTGYTANDNLKVFTSSMRHAGLEPEQTYSKLGYIAATRHHGDHSSAARTLAEYGFRAETGPVDTLTAPLVASEPVADDLGGWDFVDLGDILDGTYTAPTPTLAPRSDGQGLIYPGRVHSIAGEPGGGKTWLALHMIADNIRNGGAGALIDYEDTPGACVHRLRLLGLTTQQIALQFTYIRPDGPLITKGGRVATNTLAQLAALDVDIVVIDSVGESLAVEGLPPNDDDAVTQWFRRLPRMLARTGAAVIGLDHVTKSKDDRGLWAIGSQRKLAAIDGAAYGVDVKVAPTKTKDGKLTVTCAKDRHGTYQRGLLVANVAIDNVADGVTVTLAAPETTFRPTHYMEQVSKFLEDDELPCASQRGILSAISGRDGHIKAAIQCLVDEGYVKCDTTKRGKNYTLVTAFRDIDEVETLTAATAADRGPENRAAVETIPESDRGHRGPTPTVGGVGVAAVGGVSQHPATHQQPRPRPDPQSVESSTPDANPTTPNYDHVDF